MVHLAGRMVSGVINLARVVPNQSEDTSWRQVHAGWSIQAFLANNYVSIILITDISVSVRPGKKTVFMIVIDNKKGFD